MVLMLWLAKLRPIKPCIPTKGPKICAPHFPSIHYHCGNPRLLQSKEWVLYLYHYICIFWVFYVFIHRTAWKMTGNKMRQRGDDTPQVRLGHCSKDRASVHGVYTLPTELPGHPLPCMILVFIYWLCVKSLQWKRPSGTRSTLETGGCHAHCLF